MLLYIYIYIDGCEVVFYIMISFHLDIYSMVRHTGSYGGGIYSFLRKFHAVFHFSCTDIHFHQQMCEFLFSSSLPTFIIFCIFDYSHSDCGEMI